MENEKLEVAKEYADMVKRHEKEALAMVSRIATAEMSDDRREVLFKVMDYSTGLSVKSQLAQYYYKKVAEKVVEEEAVEEIEES